ncbi:Chromodomain-helicase-DNA-binding protein 4 [Sesamum alatum]|uniref:Chromodomain-helicase-DNA-binding protein 4 n=1 Tax=Sesamum alatum TaxID=300844 RepID=A0AAE1YLB1_9LAMI|nr:Chromodomain-helicase-DNA-binding protein 4 [Sesamum alatum]
MVDLGFEINRAGGAEAELRANDAGPSELNDAELVAESLRRVRAREANGFVVYTRNKRFKRRSEGVSITEASPNGEGEFEMKEDEVAKIDGRPEFTGSGGMECPKLATSGSRKMCKEILIAGRPTTPAELLQTGLLEGYSVFYNGGERELKLRGTIRGSGILCSCSLCKGASVISTREFEIHACNTYRCASRHICFENGKSLLDVVKNVRSSSVMPLEEAVQSYAGPATVKERIICQKCNGSFFAPFAAKVLCDSCKTATNSGVGAGCANSRDQSMHKVAFEDGGLPDGTALAYYAQGKKCLAGVKMGLGIFCDCCELLVSPSQFEAHAGWATRRKPYMYIYTCNGVSLHEFAVSLQQAGKRSTKESDSVCNICADGGELVLCDGCPRAFHKECASLSSVPGAKWYCTYCEKKFRRERYVEQRNVDAVAAGRVPGADPIAQLIGGSISMVKHLEEAEVIACIICRCHDFSTFGFGPRTVIVCDQCEKEYHVGCLKECGMDDLKELPEGKWFCSANCQLLHSALQKLLNAGAEKLPDSSLEILKKKLPGNNLVVDAGFDVRWRLLKGNDSSKEDRALLSQAVAIFHECFDPIIDSETGRDLIPPMVYGRKVRGQDFGGLYCAILMVNSIVVSAGIIRIFGQDMAELPLVATRTRNQGKGYFQILFSCIEKLLAFFAVKTLVLPAADSAKPMWTNKFGFEEVPEVQLENYRHTCWQMITFNGTSMLQKPVPKCRIVNQEQADSDVPLQ